MYKQLVKPTLDRASALFGLLLLLPVLVLLATVMAVSLQERPFFRQQRVGKNGKLFWLYKFRTMNSTRNAAGELLPDAKRTSRLGGWLRRTSADELPQLLNVLLGQMSLIGPRPILASYKADYASHSRHLLKPGLSGWAQVHGRNQLDWPEKFALDAWYTVHCSFWLDCQILWRTLFVLIDYSPPAKPIDPCYSTEPAAMPAS